MTLQELQACRDIRGQIESLDERIERLRSQAERTVRQLSLAPGGGRGDDHLAVYAARLEELERQLAARRIELEERRQACEMWIAELPVQQAKIMRMRYVDGVKTWGEVAQRAHYSYRHCTKIHAAALKKCP
ncbi:MAG: hypothetical protein AAGU74_08215 [Bacillota bacterium]